MEIQPKVVLKYLAYESLKMHQHKDGRQQGKNEGVKAIKSRQCRLTNTNPPRSNSTSVGPTTGIASGTPVTILTAQ
jgi:hypothetical protein